MSVVPESPEPESDPESYAEGFRKCLDDLRKNYPDAPVSFGWEGRPFQLSDHFPGDSHIDFIAPWEYPLPLWRRILIRVRYPFKGRAHYGLDVHDNRGGV